MKFGVINATKGAQLSLFESHPKSYVKMEPGLARVGETFTHFSLFMPWSPATGGFFLPTGPRRSHKDTLCGDTDVFSLCTPPAPTHTPTHPDTL